MPRQSEFERRIGSIEDLVRQLETATDPAARAASQELVRALMELHGVALDRILKAIRLDAPAGDAIMEQLSGDDLVSSVLLLYDLHPVELDVRVRAALDKTRPYLKSHGGDVELIGIEQPGVVRLRMQGSCHGCPSSAVTLKLAIEQAIHEAAPDVSAIEVEGQAEPHPAAPVLVALKANGKNGGPELNSGWHDVANLGSLRSGAHQRLEIDGRDLLFCRWDDTLYAYGARCPACDADLEAGTLVARTLTCPGCGEAYDVVQAGRATSRPTLHLEPFPLLSRNGSTQVALPPLSPALEPA